MSNIYTPPNCQTLDKLGVGQIRIGIQGAPFSGKTTSSLTFPNPIVASFDRKVSAHTERADVINVPFYDPQYCDSVFPRRGLKCPPNRRDALLKFLDGEGQRLTNEQTLILDNSTGIEEAYHAQYAVEKLDFVTQSGEENKFTEWRMKGDFFTDLHTYLISLKCNVVYLTHESPDRDKKGELNGKLRPLLTGAFGDKLAKNYTDWFAMETVKKPSNTEQKQKLADWADTDLATVNEWCASCSPTQDTIYLWQTQSDALRMCGTTTLKGCPKYILANYSSFSKYRNKPQQTK